MIANRLPVDHEILPPTKVCLTHFMLLPRAAPPSVAPDAPGAAPRRLAATPLSWSGSPRAQRGVPRLERTLGSSARASAGEQILVENERENEKNK